jgi:hypothetical protein
LTSALAALIGIVSCDRLSSIARQFALPVDHSAAKAEPRAKAASSSEAADPPKWAQKLRLGPNGPIPVIVVDQIGYRTHAAKVAVIRNTQRGYDRGVEFIPGTRYALIRVPSAETVKLGEPIRWHHGEPDASSGDAVWWFDFSDVTAPGRYFILDAEKDVRSVEFEIRDDIYANVMKHALRMFFYQRAGCAKSPKHAGTDWADTASHLGPGQDPQSAAWLDKTNQGARRDLRGGWFDAGDYNKYTSWTARNVIVLLRAYEENATAFTDNLGIPESGNGIPDLLDETKWALDWLLRMQGDDGSLLCVHALASGSPPSKADGPSYYGPPTTAATLMGAAAFAYAAKLFAARPERELVDYATRLRSHAIQAWQWAQAHPRVVYYNNDEVKQPGSLGLAAGQQEADDAGRLVAKFEAATYLWEETGEAEFDKFLASTYRVIADGCAPNQWDTDRQEALLYYANLSRCPSAIREEILARFLRGIRNNADQLPMITGAQDPYRAPIKDYDWGSNYSKAMQARLYQLFAKDVGDPTSSSSASSAAEDYVHYLHGVNPLGLVYLTNMSEAGAEHSARTLYHWWFKAGDPKWGEVTAVSPGPAPGYLVGGPNPRFELDRCCQAPFWSSTFRCNWSAEFALCKRNYVPPLAQPAQKSYLQFNSGWPAASWSVTEPSTGYQAQYIRVLAEYTRPNGSSP